MCEPIYNFFVSLTLHLWFWPDLAYTISRLLTHHTFLLFFATISSICPLTLCYLRESHYQWAGRDWVFPINTPAVCELLLKLGSKQFETFPLVLQYLKLYQGSKEWKYQPPNHFNCIHECWLKFYTSPRQSRAPQNPSKPTRRTDRRTAGQHNI